MAERNTVSFDSVMRDLKARKFAPVYVLMGEESYYIDRIASYIEENVLQPDERFFNQTVVFGSDVNASQVTDLAKGYPMMPAQYRVVIVKEAQNLRSLELLEKYLDKPVSTTVLVLCHKNGSIDRRKKIVAKADAVGVVFESKKKRDYELPTFIASYLKQQRVGIDNKSAMMIVEHIGADLSRLISELDKLVLSMMDGQRMVTPEMVERQIGVSKDFNTFELRSAIISKNSFKANQIISYFEKNPKSGSLYAFMPLIFNFFQNLMVAYYAPDRNSESDVAQFLELRSTWLAKDYILAMRNYSASKTLEIISKIRETDAKSKGLDNLNTSVSDLMKELVFFILH